MTEEVSKKIEDFFNAYPLRKLPKGQMIILGGDDTTYVYNLIKGRVKQYDVSYRGDEVILNVFQPPAFFPMSMAVNKVPNPYIYEAETAIEVRQAPSNEVIMFLQSNPDVLFDLLSRVYKGVDGILGRMSRLMSGTAKSRLMYELILEARRAGFKGNDSACLIDLTEKDIGARAGLSRETVSREMHKLKAEKLVEVRSSGICIASLAELEAKLGQDI